MNKNYYFYLSIILDALTNRPIKAAELLYVYMKKSYIRNKDNFQYIEIF